MALLLDVDTPVDVDAPDGQGDTALGLASKNGQLAVVELLLAHGVQLGYNNYSEWALKYDRWGLGLRHNGMPCFSTRVTLSQYSRISCTPLHRVPLVGPYKVVVFTA